MLETYKIEVVRPLVDGGAVRVEFEGEAILELQDQIEKAISSAAYGIENGLKLAAKEAATDE